MELDASKGTKSGAVDRQMSRWRGTEGAEDGEPALR